MRTAEYGKMTFNISDDGTTCTVGACARDAVVVEIPPSIDGITVVGIDERAFEWCRELRQISFPTAESHPADCNTFSEIGANAFYGCTSLMQADIPDTVTFIGHGAFAGCESLHTARFGRDTVISDYAFSECRNLVNVTNLDDVAEGVFSGCASLPAMPITDKTERIEEDAFEHCDSLISITVPASVRWIGALAFRGCAALTSVRFEDPSGWYARSVYTAEEFALDLSDAEENARQLRGMDFDDGIYGWYRL